MSSESHRTKRHWIAGSTLGAGVVLIVVLVGLINYFGWKYHYRADWTSTRLYSLSDKSISILSELEGEIEVVLFMDPDDELYPPTRELLDRYEAASPRITVREIDQVRNLVEAQALVDRYQLTSDNVVVFAVEGDPRVIEAADLADYDYSGMQFGQGPEMTGFKGEQVFTGAILELVEARKPKIVWTIGHGEIPLDDFSETGMSRAQDLLGRDNFELEEWSSLADPEAPDGADLVIVAGPTAGFIEPEIEALRDYLDGGGRMLVMLEPVIDEATSDLSALLDLLREFGVRVGRDIVVDPEGAVPFYGAETFFSTSFGVHPVTDGLSQSQLPVIFPLARSVGAAAAVGGLTVDELVLTGPGGWGETDLANLDRVELQETDLAGPVPLAVAVSGEALLPAGLEAEDLPQPEEAGSLAASAEGEASTASGEVGGDVIEATGGEGELRLIVIGDRDFATNAQLANVGNAPLLSNAVNWLVERETLVSIPPRKPEQVRLSLTRGEMSAVTWIVLLILPALAISAGVAVHLRRRR